MRHHLLNKQGGQYVGQLGDEELFLFAENRTHRPQGRPDAQRGSCRRVRLHRALLQSEATPFQTELPEPHGIRKQAMQTEPCVHKTGSRPDRCDLSEGAPHNVQPAREKGGVVARSIERKGEREEEIVQRTVSPENGIRSCTLSPMRQEDLSGSSCRQDRSATTPARRRFWTVCRWRTG